MERVWREFGRVSSTEFHNAQSLYEGVAPGARVVGDGTVDVHRLKRREHDAQIRALLRHAPRTLITRTH